MMLQHSVACGKLRTTEWWWMSQGVGHSGRGGEGPERGETSPTHMPGQVPNVSKLSLLQVSKAGVNNYSCTLTHG